jgi:hypothetical protein
MEEARARFESKLQPQENGCINWTGGIDKNGYGIIQVNHKQLRAHRLSWFLAGNTIPDGLILRHKCKQNRVCCNTEHLETGTYQDNANDTIRDGTSNKGVKNGRCKLTAEQILEIRARTNELHSDLAKEFKVSRVLINHIILRYIWTHI